MPASAHELERLAKACSTHLGLEEDVLTDTLRLVEQMRQTLRKRDIEGVLATVARLEENQRNRGNMQKERAQLRERIGAHLEVSLEQATLSTVITRIPAAWRDHLEDQRRHLQDLAKSVDNLNRANLALVASFSEILSRVLFDLTGQVTARRYGPTGRLDSTDSTLVFEKNY